MSKLEPPSGAELTQSQLKDTQHDSSGYPVGSKTSAQIPLFLTCWVLIETMVKHSKKW